MDIAALILNICLLIATGGAAVASISQARVAQRAQRGAKSAQAKAESARDEALLLAREANAAFVRQAEAQERANEIEASKLPNDGARWSIRHVRGARYVMQNIGNRTAEGLTIHEMQQPSGFLRHDHDGPVDVAPSDVIELMALGADGSPNVKVQLRWHEGDGPLLTDDSTIIL